MKISHEVPFCLLQESLYFNDYDYALVHLFNQNPDYFDFFIKSLDSGREVILDNSVFELGQAFDGIEYEYWIDQLEPTYAIIPDKFEDVQFTIDSVKRWQSFFKCRKTKSIGVIQGRTLDEFTRCYEELSPLVDTIAISFAQPLFERLYPLENKDFARIYGRFHLINHLKAAGVIDINKKHHLLGCSLPQELLLYKNTAYSFINSIDSSSPIVHGINNIRFTRHGLNSKIETKLCDLIGVDNLSPELLDCIRHNIGVFKSFTL